MFALCGCVTTVEEGKSFNSYSCFKSQDNSGLVECSMFNNEVNGNLIFHTNNKRDIPHGDPSNR